jgi:hypothetical protein
VGLPQVANATPTSPTVTISCSKLQGSTLSWKHIPNRSFLVIFWVPGGEIGAKIPAANPNGSFSSPTPVDATFFEADFNGQPLGQAVCS